MSIKELEHFIVKSDKGKEYTIILYQEYLSADDFGGSEEVEGLKYYITSTGLNVNRIDANTFEIVADNCIARRI